MWHLDQVLISEFRILRCGRKNCNATKKPLKSAGQLMNQRATSVPIGPIDVEWSANYKPRINKTELNHPAGVTDVAVVTHHEELSPRHCDRAKVDELARWMTLMAHVRLSQSLAI
jgi:hypothetical protein